MSGLESWLTPSGGSPYLALAAAILLGLRHATDPDHIAAVATLALDSAREGPRRARALGTAWGLGHGVTLLLLGLPVVLFRRFIPPIVQQGAEVAVGVIIVGLALRLLWRWRGGKFHAHIHAHDNVRHAHPHLHESRRGAPEHGHRHSETLGRSPRAAFGIGLVHGVGGSAGAALLLVGAAGTRAIAVAALILFAAGTAVSMMAVSWLLGSFLAGSSLKRGLDWLIPVLGGASLCFGAWYGIDALGY